MIRKMVFAVGVPELIDIKREALQGHGYKGFPNPYLIRSEVILGKLLSNSKIGEIVIQQLLYMLVPSIKLDDRVSFARFSQGNDILFYRFNE